MSPDVDTEEREPAPEPPLLPARILNEYVYCPRLAYLEWVESRFAESADTVEGSIVHEQVDRARGKVPDPADLVDGGEDPPPTTSLTLSSERLGLIGKVDMVVFSAGKVRPLEYKRGRPRSAENPLWEPELAQVCAQVLLLEEAGYDVDGAEVYFAETRSRHRVEVDVARKQWATEKIEAARAMATAEVVPPPLVDSPKCPRCSLVGICLPDELNLLRGRTEKLRKLIAGDSPASPLYVTKQGARLSKRGGRAVLVEDGQVTQARRILDVSHVALFGNVDVSGALMRELCDRGIPVLWFTFGGWFSGIATGMPPGNAELRMRQHRAASLGEADYAAEFVAGKIKNARTLLMRHAKPRPKEAIGQLAELAKRARAETSMQSLLGIEGVAARLYFQHFGKLIRDDGSFGVFDFNGRNRRPPRDRVNALLSFSYALLVRDTVVACLAAGLDPYIGLYHRPRFGRPALALDLAEEFRSLVGDSTVVTAINNGEIRSDDFVERAGGVALTAAGRKTVIDTYERRMRTELHHPIFGYKASYRRILEIQARLLAAVLCGDSPEYRSLTTR